MPPAGDAIQIGGVPERCMPFFAVSAHAPSAPPPQCSYQRCAVESCRGASACCLRDRRCLRFAQRRVRVAPLRREGIRGGTVLPRPAPVITLAARRDGRQFAAAHRRSPACPPARPGVSPPREAATGPCCPAETHTVLIRLLPGFSCSEAGGVGAAARQEGGSVCARAGARGGDPLLAVCLRAPGGGREACAAVPIQWSAARSGGSRGYARQRVVCAGAPVGARACRCWRTEVSAALEVSICEAGVLAARNMR